MFRFITLVATTMMTVGCMETDNIEIFAEADTPFTHEETLVPDREKYNIEETDVPEGVEISLDSEGMNLVMISGTLEEGTYDFQLTFEHYGDQPGYSYNRWLVTIYAE